MNTMGEISNGSTNPSIMIPSDMKVYQVMKPIPVSKHNFSKSFEDSSEGEY